MYFPTLCVDNFFENPEEVRKFALSLEYFPAPDGAYPGKRTETLYDIDREFFHKFGQKLFSLFYNFQKSDVDWIIDARFQLIDPFENNDLNEGWIHIDYTAVFSGVVYLTPLAEKESGTVICKLKSGENFDYVQKEKRDFNLGKFLDTEQYIKLRNDNNSQFEDTVYFSNQFNRMIAFDAKTFHRVQNFNTKSESRLTLVFFVNKIEADWFPIPSFRKITI